MKELLERFLPQNWENLDLLLNITVIVAVLWLITNIFIIWRRKQTNLTPVDAPRASSKAQPDFLSVDKKADKAAKKRGDQYARSLDERERAEAESMAAAQQSSEAIKQAGVLRKFLGYATIALSLVSLIVVLLGSIMPTSAVGKLMGDYEVEGRISDVFQKHPIAIVVTILVMVFLLASQSLMRSNSRN